VSTPFSLRLTDSHRPVAGLVGLFSGGWCDRYALLVDGVVVGVAQGCEVGEIGGATVCPMLNVVRVCVLGWSGAGRVDAATVSAREDAS
jgi:hypothetical protein